MLMKSKLIACVIACSVLAPLPAHAGAGWFILGLIAGNAMSDSPPGSMQQNLSGIPLRCFAALEESDDAYKECRRPSLRYEVMASSALTRDGQRLCTFYSKDYVQTYGDYPAADCGVEKPLDWELKALHAMADAAKAKAGAQ
jgi:hypothetical protein